MKETKDTHTYKKKKKIIFGNKEIINRKNENKQFCFQNTKLYEKIIH